ncbi:PDZ domain-containing protein [Fibrobacter sp. UWR2]|uniref:PDZ domain-containing protein n=1 Tax=Fibrobacter sp. UWR2 TaxID=1964352 RepID=UPI000B5291F8|nr:PDZ domain-containing protein [Fibrobacter sp. UWR2]OWU99760.1 hypothetical protein B7994_10595 [Fibrobacter sp. UWR2]
MNKIIVYLFAIFFAGCATSGFVDFYRPWYDDNFFPSEAYLKENEEPAIISTSDLDTKYREIASNWYWCIGYSGFNGPDLDSYEIYEGIKKLCKRTRAKVAIWKKNYTDTRSGVYSISNSVYSYSVQRYDFSAYLFIPIPNKYRNQYAPGFSISNLTQQDRERYQQNTGCLVEIVYKNTVAYYANILHGDIITQINNRRIYSIDDIRAVRANSRIGDVWNMVIVRNGKPQEVTLKYGL